MAIGVGLVGLGHGMLARAAEPAVTIPPPALDPKPAAEGPHTIVLAGGCFWGVQGVFEHTKGVIRAVSGYSGGSKETAHYEMVGTETTGHAESVQVTYDPKQISYGKILQIYFSVAHNPTELNYQGPDSGPSYRSAIFYANDEQKRVAKAYIAQLKGKCRAASANSMRFCQSFVISIYPRAVRRGTAPMDRIFRPFLECRANHKCLGPAARRAHDIVYVPPCGADAPNPLENLRLPLRLLRAAQAAASGPLSRSFARGLP